MDEMTRESQLKEIREAIQAGNQTMGYLENARDALQSASNFGIADMLGFDLIGGIGKHVKLGHAREQMEKARLQVANFQKELKDVSMVLDFQIDIGGFLTFADFFLDGILADVLVQSRIGEMKEQVAQAMGQIDRIMQDLYRMEREVSGR
jgi:hypothetical protein